MGFLAALGMTAQFCYMGGAEKRRRNFDRLNDQPPRCHSERSEESRTNPNSLTNSFHFGFMELINNSFLFLFHF
ncbi:MAG: hypothetical protein LBI45_06870, partial [Bacteroidales bacterium]|nr:hypothetical protein [Bacteroidales bacterium]